jgi:hypothetical protein
MGVTDILLAILCGHSLSDVNPCFTQFPNGIKKVRLTGGATQVMTGYKAAREIQHDRGRSFGSGISSLIEEMRAGVCSTDSRYLYIPVK